MPRNGQVGAAELRQRDCGTGPAIVHIRRYLSYRGPWSRFPPVFWKGGDMQRNLSVARKHPVRKKVRGSKRKLRSLGRKLDSILLCIPDENLPHDKSWRYHLPSPDKLIDSTNSSYKLRRRFIQLLADKLHELDLSIKDKYNSLLFLSFPLLSHSRIEVCVDGKHFEKLVHNSDAASTWSTIADGRSITREFGIALPPEYQEKGYFETSKKLKGGENWIIWKSR
jgi:hypothetical protein